MGQDPESQLGIGGLTVSPRALITRSPGQPHSLLEDVLLTVMSAAILFAAIAIVFTPQKMNISVAAAASSNPRQISFYGILLDEFGDPVKGADRKSVV